MTKVIAQFTTCLALVFACTPAAVAEQDWRVSLGLGKASAQFENSLGTVADIDDTDTSLHVSLSYELIDTINVSLSYRDLGQGEFSFTAETTDPDALQASNADIAPVLGDGMSLSLEYSFYSIKQFHFTMELGLFDWEAEIDSVTNGNLVSTGVNGTDFLLGLGAYYRLSEAFDGHLKVNRYNLEPNKVNELYVGLTYVF